MPDWLFGGLILLGVIAATTLGVIADRLARIIKLLEIVSDELNFANKDAREIERRERYPDLPY